MITQNLSILLFKKKINTPLQLLRNRAIGVMVFFCLLACCAAGQERGMLVEKLEKTTNDSQKIIVYRDLLTNYKMVDPDSAELIGEQGLLFAQKKNYLLGEGVMMAHLARIDQSQGRMDLATQRLGYALQIFKEQKYVDGIAFTNNALGSIEGSKGNFENAIRYFSTALKLYEQQQDNSGMLIAYINIGALYLQRADTARAEQFLMRAEEISKKMPVVDATISLYNNLGVLYNYKGNTKKALEYFLNDVKISDDPKFLYSHIESLLYLGIFYNDLGDAQNSIIYLKQALALAKDKSLPSDEAEILVELANVTNKKDHLQALAYLKQAREIGEYIHSKLLMVKLYKQMAIIYEQQGNFKEALNAIKIEQALNDSIAEVNRSREMTSLSATYELKRSNAKIKKLETINKDNVQRHKLLVLGGVVAGCVIFIFLIIFINTQKLNKRLRKSERDLKEINNTKNKLLSIIGHDLKGPVAMIPAVIDICNDASTSEEERQMLLHTLKEHTLATVDTLDKLLYWGQSIMKGTNLKQEEFKTKPLISASIKFKKISLTEKKIELIDNTPEELKVRSELAHFDFIIRNLLANAIKFTGRDGKIIIDADLNSLPGMAIFSVQDNGIGIDKDRLQTIFVPFHSKEGTANEKGTGIGLMLCKEFAIKNGGDIWVESEAGKGSKFFYSVKLGEVA